MDAELREWLMREVEIGGRAYVRNFTAAAVLALVRNLTPDLWSRYGSRPGRITSVLDLGVGTPTPTWAT